MSNRLSKKLILVSVLLFISLLITLIYFSFSSMEESKSIKSDDKENTQDTNQSVKSDDKENTQDTNPSFLYPEFSLSGLSSIADNIFRGVVTSIGESELRPVYVSLTENPDDYDDILYYPIIPIHIEVINSVKGNINNEFTFYLEEVTNLNHFYQNMDVILFLNSEGFGWGEQSVYPIIDNKVFLNYNIIAELTQSGISDSIEMVSETTAVCDVGIFLNYISSFINPSQN